MNEQPIAVVDLADELQVRKQTLFKILKRLGIRPTQRREPARGNQNVALITSADAESIRRELARSQKVPSGFEARPSSAVVDYQYPDDVGVFYLIELEPDQDPGRFKVGFTMELEGRLRKHRCSAPFARCHRSWPCKRTWERAAIDSATEGCEQLHTEVFRAASISAVSARADAFFSIMPNLASSVPEQDEESGDAR